MLEIYGLIFTCIIGTIGHFLYDFSHKNKIIGFLFATNESTWEHLKLGITPIVIYGVFELFLTQNLNNIVNTSIKVITFSIILITFYYVIKHLLKKNILILDISIFYFSSALAYLVGAKIGGNNYSFIVYLASFIFYIILYLSYKKFSHNPPNNFLFKTEV